MKDQIDVTIWDIPLTLFTNEKSFSPKQIDAGTLFMLSNISPDKGMKILDLGCGYGIVGILCAKVAGEENVTMSDIDINAIALSKRNAEINDVNNIKIIQSNSFESIDNKDFDLILSNPPYHTDFSVAKSFIEKGFNRLKINGKMYMVTKRKEWYKKKFISIFGGVKISEQNGYFLFSATKKNSSYASKK